MKQAIIIVIAHCMVIVSAINEADGEIKQVIVCEGEHANLSCPEGRYIAIRLANYGRFTISQCNPTFNTELSTTCQNDKTLGILQLRCNGKFECEFPVNNDHLGDACPKTSKYLDLQYDCTLIPVTTPTTTTTTTKKKIDARMPTDVHPSASYKGENPETIHSFYEESKPGVLHCQPVSFRDIEWPKTEADRVARMGCPIGSDGHAEWKCEANGEWNKEGADLSRCVSSWSSRLREEAEDGEEPIDHLETLREIQQMTRKEELLGGDLIALSAAIDSSIPTTMQSSNADAFAELVVESVNNMAKESQSPAWSDLNAVKSRKVATALMESVDKVAAGVSMLTTPDTTRTIIKPTVEVEISNVKVHEYVTFPSMSLYTNSYDTIDVPKEALTLRDQANAHAKVVYATYSSMATHMEPESRTNADGVLVERLVATNILSTSIVNKASRIQTISRLKHPVILTFRTKSWSNLTSPTCVWWNSTRLSWSSNGCSLELHNTTHTVCHCDHLTHFAVLMDVYDHELPVEHNVMLTFITYAGCSLSVICLLLSLFAFHCFGSGGDRICIHNNLCFCLLVAETVFLLGIWQTQNKLYCGIIAGVLHYFFLAAFTWMLLEGFELYYMLVEVFQSRDSKKPYFYLFGYGCPAVVVTVATWMDRFSYGTERYCWLRADNYFILSFVGPVAVILVCNCAFLMMTLCIVCRHSNVGYTPCKQDRDTIKNVRSWLKGAMALVFLLGLTWTFGLLWIDEQSTVMAYAFTTLNSLQGLFIFLFHVVFNDRMHKDYRKWTRRTSWLPDCMREESARSRPSPYMPATGSGTAQGLSSNSSTGSELLYPSLTNEKYPPHMVAAIDPRYNNCVQMMLARPEIASSGMYDYATIAYGDMCSRPPPSCSYYNPLQRHTGHTPSTHGSPRLHYHPPPTFPPPPPPPPAPGIADLRVSPRPHSSTMTKLSDDSAYSDGSSTMHYPGEMNTTTSGMLLRMDLTKNPPVFVQGM
uniref:Latrophilin-1 n=1 Tax=Ascaris suum TaxID=6253 RepID=F1KS60_ASCSU